MAAVFSLVTWSGPVVSVVGLYLDSSVTFWIGVAIACFNLFMNVASEAMRFPLLPLAFVVVGAIFWQSWYMGAAFGILTWTVLEAIGELGPFRRLLRRISN